MSSHFSIMVPGAQATGKKEVCAPFDGKTIATIDVGGAAAVEKALATAHALYRDRDAWLPPAKRIADPASKAASIMEARAEELALEAAREGGKPLVDSRVEVARAIDGMANCAEILRSEAGHVIPMNINAASAGRVAFTQREPIGVVVAVSAFNHPAQPDRAPGRSGARRRLPGDRQAGRATRRCRACAWSRSCTRPACRPRGASRSCPSRPSWRPGW